MTRDTFNARQPGYINVDDDTALHYRDWGDGVPLVFLSGWTLNADMWNYQCAPLAAAGFRCVAYDRRGHGRSSDPGRGYDYDTLADDLEAVLAARGLARVTLVGHSFASGEIVRYLSRHGSRRVAGVVLVSPASTPCLLKTADNPGGLDASLFEASIEEMLTSFPDWISRRAEAYFGPGTSHTVIQWTADMMLGASLHAAVQLSRVQMVTDFRRELAAIDVPALVLHGDCDASAPLEITGRPTADALEHATLKVYEGGTHGMYFNHAARVNGDIREFVKRWQA
ncbi:alpha/beta fold hydrolase [Paraburkholderia silvatlantica]|uniref:Pimeloyl-ACP methyl ester carboxylesterase n=1 Tax=Paraburkholderia silvatlantica TaxID=321895 RepID=A0A2U1A7B6_9BURK|nr:alpha/beta hydrolase [Paraburkholderia silvatlantica]MBB2931372.1 pimeloyl-ACP methyl ester carboxylesterase [Paraburkholderia silvatlantica]PVY28195.1 pimeloyl-ACP methyl ester carboxylesterase [Paraburkholderia silvatlantica]PXW34880.1 pimeloyl-ACP methyl ester carboxylesterase [Paraburkholderia silvatlantica]PYE15185.1 pimeloyl-ACP methyl ester carboxylesterase [Paraburkholderia silvatlantica]TDQ98787.1 pimeloyl-ACP methyl ester carboxylesterase [Paraburkholderia silvatlantica]